MDNVTVSTETVYNSSNSTNLTRNLNKNRKKSIKLTQIHVSVTLSDSLNSLNSQNHKRYQSLFYGTTGTIRNRNNPEETMKMTLELIY